MSTFADFAHAYSHSLMLLQSAVANAISAGGGYATVQAAIDTATNNHNERVLAAQVAFGIPAAIVANKGVTPNPKASHAQTWLSSGGANSDDAHR